jgi:excisionase family DNA binding protein
VRFMSPREIAQVTGLSYHAVLRAIADGELRASKLRGRIIVRDEWFEAWVAQGVLSPAPAAPAQRARRAPRSRRRPGPADDAPGSVARLTAIENGAA